MQRILIGLMVLGVLAAQPAAAQRRGPANPPPRKEFSVPHSRAISVTREVLVRQGYEIVRVEVRGNDRIVWYRRGDMGRGRGKGPLVKLILRRVNDRIVWVDTPNVILVDINVKLRV